MEEEELPRSHQGSQRKLAEYMLVQQYFPWSVASYLTRWTLVGDAHTIPHIQDKQNRADMNNGCLFTEQHLILFGSFGVAVDKQTAK